jgi:hypothetical protein
MLEKLSLVRMYNRNTIWRVIPQNSSTRFHDFIRGPWTKTKSIHHELRKRQVTNNIIRSIVTNEK